MKIYFGCPTGQRRNEMVEKYGDKYGACLTRDVFNNITARMMPWFFDNGAFSDWKTGKAFDFTKFTKRLLEIESKVRFADLPHPDFVVVPDKVTKGQESLSYSRKWVNYLKKTFPNYEYYLAVQNDMDPFWVDIALARGDYEGLFLGGTKAWKYETGESWVKLAKKYNVPIHAGGIGTRKNILWAKMTGFDSVDSGVAMIHPGHLKDIYNLENELLWNVA